MVAYGILRDFMLDTMSLGLSSCPTNILFGQVLLQSSSQRKTGWTHERRSARRLIGLPLIIQGFSQLPREICPLRRFLIIMHSVSQVQA